MLGKHYLCAVVTQDAANWSTPESHPRTHTPRNVGAGTYRGKEPLANQVAEVHGQADPASSSSLGSRQGLWPTASVPNGGQTTSGRADKGTKKQVRLEHAVAQWATPGTTQAAMNGQGAPTLQALVENGIATNIRNRKWKNGQVDTRPRGNGVALASQAMAAQWATPKTPTGGPETAKRKQELGRTLSGCGDLASQANGRLNSQWVTQLMGLNLGWVSPSCPASVIKNWPRFVSGWCALTIAPMSCDCSAMELCLPPQSGLFEFSLAS
jgi:hypothetical protein